MPTQWRYRETGTRGGAVTTRIRRALGPDKKAAEMSASDDANRADDPRAGGQQPSVDRARQRRWVPGTAALLTFLIGLADILNILRPDLVSRLHRFNSMIPRPLTDVTRSADVLIGLMLLLL